MRHGLFETDVLIAELWGAAQRGATPLSSEKRLMVAVLHDAFECYQKYIFADDRVGRELFAEAEAWLNCKSSRGLFSFESISETLDIEPDYFRRGLAAWHKRRVEMQIGANPAAAVAEENKASANQPNEARAARR